MTLEHLKFVLDRMVFSRNWKHFLLQIKLDCWLSPLPSPCRQCVGSLVPTFSRTGSESWLLPSKCCDWECECECVCVCFTWFANYRVICWKLNHRIGSKIVGRIVSVRNLVVWGDCQLSWLHFWLTCSRGNLAWWRAHNYGECCLSPETHIEADSRNPDVNRRWKSIKDNCLSKRSAGTWCRSSQQISNRESRLH